MDPERDGNEWERRVKAWLRLRYPGGQFEEVPPEHLGDFGIEGFSRDGIAYQCYAPKSALKTKELYEAQRIKVTNDIRKFIDNKNELSRLFGSVKIKSWWLIIPEHRSAKLVQHATMKAAEVRKANLPYVTADFTIHIATAEDFAVERAAAVRQGIEALQLEQPVVTTDDVRDWADNNDKLVSTLDRKITAYSGERKPEKVRDIREGWITSFIIAENMLKNLEQKYPRLWIAFAELKRRKETHLFVNYSHDRAGADVLKETIGELGAAMLREIPNLDERNAEDVAVGTVADWLQRCPLDFPDGTSSPQPATH
jgi:hypothetical protein